MEFMGLCCGAPFLLAFVIAWTRLHRAGTISRKLYLGVFAGIGVLACLAVASEIRYLVFVEDLANAACEGNVSKAEWLLSHGSDPNEPDENGVLPLQCAVVNDHPDVVRVLLAHGADPNISVGIDKQASVLRFAGDHQMPATVKLLKAAGARP
ncbi:MAG: hypothetical protein QOJ65_1897 [Fimbriimonadaceae bacterium]|jgi:hypothetical protein|nr:hypothetical protein [Fimbriimonadaceae bacterium]